MTWREIAIAAPLVVMAVVLGVFPATLLNYTDATVAGLVEQLNPARLSAPRPMIQVPLNIEKTTP
jgi:NADH:ubiquinone oxidoreductase subunit 4 (subunit M)